MRSPVNSRKPNKGDKANSLRTLRDKPNGLKKFMDAHPEEVDGDAFNRYLDASATPSGNRTKGRSK